MGKYTFLIISIVFFVIALLIKKAQDKKYKSYKIEKKEDKNEKN